MIQLKPGITTRIAQERSQIGRAPRPARTKRASLPGYGSSAFSVTPKSRPFDQIEWERRTAEITDDAGKVIFKQENVEVPKIVVAARDQSGRFRNIFTAKQRNIAERETSVRQLIHRVTPHDRRLGNQGWIFQQGGRRDFLRRVDLALREPIRRVQFAGLVQRRSLSSNTASARDAGTGNWFYNRKTGEAERAATQYEYPQGSACFIQSVEDNMEDIMRLATAKRCCSSMAPAPAPICRRCVPARKS